MSMTIGAINPSELHAMQRRQAEEPEKKTGFTDSLKQAIDGVNNDLAKADEAVQDLATGRRRTLHETMIATEQAHISFKMLMAVRGKLVSAYQEIMRMQV